MQDIYKYPIRIIGIQSIHMPKGAEILCVQLQHDEPFIWARVNPGKPGEGRVIEVFGTGHGMEEASRIYIGTVQTQDSLVWHVFEKL